MDLLKAFTKSNSLKGHKPSDAVGSAVHRTTGIRGEVPDNDCRVTKHVVLYVSMTKSNETGPGRTMVNAPKQNVAQFRPQGNM